MQKKIDSVKSLITSIVGLVAVHYSQVNDFVFDYAGLFFLKVSALLKMCKLHSGDHWL